MSCLRQLPLVASIVLSCALPQSVAAQNTGIVASATILARPLSVAGLAWTAVPGELRISVDGCGSGALTVDAQSATGTTRVTRLVLASTADCRRRNVALQLPVGTASGPQPYLVTLEHADVRTAPGFVQFSVIASSRPTARTTLAY
jgi:hypothetical protein